MCKIKKYLTLQTSYDIPTYFTIQLKTSLKRRILAATLVTYILCFRVGNGDLIDKPLNIYFLLLYRYLISKLINTMISFILWHVFANKDLDKVPTNLLNCQTLLSIYNYFLSVRSMLEAKGPTINNYPNYLPRHTKTNIQYT